jgi:hypothetical protein
MSYVVRGALVAILFGAAASIVKADDPITFQDPAANSTVTLPMMQSTFTIKYKVTDRSWSMMISAKLLKENGDGSFSQLAETSTCSDVFVAGVYDHTEVTFNEVYASGSGFKISIRMSKFVSDPYEQLYTTSLAGNITIVRE